MGRRVYNKTEYNRPERKWECARARLGTPCPKGPTILGKCGGQYECSPAFVENRWLCTRPDHYGGPCDRLAPGGQQDFGPIAKKDGSVECCRPTGCTPRRTLRARRAVFTQGALCLSVGILLLGIGSTTFRDRFLSPGPLTRHHQGASFGQGRVEHIGVDKDASEGNSTGASCNACHLAMDEDRDGNRAYRFGWLSAAFGREDRLSQNRKCLVCHGMDWVAQPHSPHGLPESTLARITESTSSKTRNLDPFLMLASAAGVPTTGQGELTCATCHHEHQGRGHDLKVLSDRQCQVCHRQQFSSFNSGHPQFSTIEANGYAYPHERRTRIVFDHNRPEHREYGDCSTCHLADNTGRFMKLAAFEQTCAAAECHGDAFSKSEPVQFFGYPLLTGDAIEYLAEDFDIDLHDWPDTSPSDRQEALSPFMIALLGLFPDDYPGGVEQFEVDLAELHDPAQAGGSVSTLIEIYWEEEEEEIPPLDRIATALQSLYARFANEGGDMPSGGVIAAALRAGDSESLMRTEMLGEFATGVSLESILNALTEESRTTTSGWEIEEEGRQISDEFWSSMLEDAPGYSAARGFDSNSASAFIGWLRDLDQFRPWFEGRIRAMGRIWRSRASGLEINKRDWSRFLATTRSAEGLKALSEAAKTNDEIGEFVQWFQDPDKVRDWLRPRVRIAESGWYASDSARSVYYRPQRHRDPFLVAWLDYSAAEYTRGPGVQYLFNALVGNDSAGVSAVGACVKCHSVDVTMDERGEKHVHLNWNAKKALREFTTFDHGPHLKLMDCAACHQLSLTKDAPPFLDGFKAKDGAGIGVDFTTFRSNFMGLQRGLCAECHSSRDAGNACLMCHNYHVQRTPARMGVNSLGQLFPSSVSAVVEEIPKEETEEAD